MSQESSGIPQGYLRDTPVFLTCGCELSCPVWREEILKRKQKAWGKAAEKTGKDSLVFRMLSVLPLHGIRGEEFFAFFINPNNLHGFAVN